MADPRELFGRMVFDADKALARHKIPDWDSSGVEVMWEELCDQDREDCMFTGAHIAAAMTAAGDGASEAGARRPGRIVITCTQHGVASCPCLTAPAGGSAHAAPRIPPAQRYVV